MTIKTPRFVETAIFAVRFARIMLSDEMQYEMMIATSQAKLAETKLVPGYTNVYA
jgi:hypothetical protein